MIFNLTEHATRRAQQRAIPLALVEKLTFSGKRIRMGGNAIMFIPTPVLKRGLRDSLRNTAVLVAADTHAVITVMHRVRRALRDVNTLRSHRGGRPAKSL